MQRRTFRPTPWQMLALLACGLLAWIDLRQPPLTSGDTVSLISGAHGIMYCVSHGIWSRCDQAPAIAPAANSMLAAHQVVQGGVNPFPLFQYLIAAAGIKLGLSDAGILKAFVGINLAACFTLIGLAGWLTSRTGRPWLTPLAVVLLSASPLIVYAGVTFGESLAALLMTLAVAAALRRWPPWALAGTAALACITKETAFPIVAVVGAACLWGTSIPSRPLRRGHWLGLAVGVAAGAGACAAFNYFRYAHLTNYTYGQSFEHVHGLFRRLGLSVAVWLAPNGGVVWFWPLATALVIGLLVIVVTGVVAGGARRRRAVAAAGLLMGLLILTGTLGSWYSPFGWQAWGPRIALPTVASVVVASLVTYTDELAKVIERMCARSWTLLATLVVVLALGLPQVNVLTDPHIVGELFTTPPASKCPSILPVPDAYLRCQNQVAWEAHSILVYSYHALSNLRGALYAIVFGLIWCSAILLVRSGSLTHTTETGPDMERACHP